MSFCFGYHYQECVLYIGNCGGEQREAAGNAIIQGYASSQTVRANPSFIKSLKLQIGEDADYDKVIARYRSQNPGLGGIKDDGWSKNMRVVPVNFNTGKAMLGHCKMILESEGGRIAINPIFDKLITSLRTAVDNDGTLDKETTSHHDIFDAFRLALKFYEFKQV